VTNRKDFTTLAAHETTQSLIANLLDERESMLQRQKHQEDVRRYLQQHFRIRDWGLSLPRGSGMETYFAQGDGQKYFIKVGVAVEPYSAMAEAGLTPPIIAQGELEGGPSIMIQPFIEGRKPSSKDFCDQLEKVAAIVHKMHHDSETRAKLPSTASNDFRYAGLRALHRLLAKWERYKTHFPTIANFVDRSIDRLSEQVSLFSGEGLVASHNDICNANWLFASDGKIYIVDFESMSLDDPAADLGALLWWYYPPDLRQRFLERAGYPYDDEFKLRMRLRMAIHCLSITLPRDGSFDQFNPERFGESLRDFGAVLDGKENPEGYIK
jgi:thiamine kinase-like enzyme